jgi:hypothetical protein
VAYIGMGLAQMQKAGYEDAIQSFERAKIVVEEGERPKLRNLYIGSAIENIGLIYIKQNLWSNALRKSDEVLEITDKKNMELAHSSYCS